MSSPTVISTVGERLSGIISWDRQHGILDQIINMAPDWDWIINMALDWDWDRLAATPGAMEALISRSPGDGRQLVKWIDSAKAEATRERRLDQAVERILGAARRR